ncbi:MAG: hypothetical protein AAF639_12770, partial [Chloroflexota bacterium]
NTTVWLTTELVIGEEPFNGYGGFVSRFQDDRNFYLFIIDSLGRFQIQLQHEGGWSTIQPWVNHDSIQNAGKSNVVRMEDTGQTLRFLNNNQLLYEISDVILPIGKVGLVGGADMNRLSEVNFHYIKVEKRLIQ